MYRFGVDEAGKGPVFGSMFAAAVWVGESATLPEGIADSKRLTPARRETVAKAIQTTPGIEIAVAEITPDRIDEPTTDMNSLTVEAHARVISDVLEGANSSTGGTSPPSGLCDACDTDADRFARRVSAVCHLEDVTIDARHGADDDSPLVGAASIIAKVERDAHMAALADEYGKVGSGYPSDRTTQQFLESYLESHGELPPFARRSWSTCKRALAETSQRGLEEF